MITPTITPLNQTFRQLLVSLDRETLLAALEKRCDPKNRSGYERVIETLLAKPLTQPRYPILLSYYPATTSANLDDEEAVHVHLLNEHYELPADGLKPWGGRKGEEPPPGYYDCNADRHNRVFGFGDSPWVEMIDAPVMLEDEAGIRKVLPTDVDIAAEVLWEWTWHGWTEGQQRAFWAELRETVDRIRQEIPLSDRT